MFLKVLFFVVFSFCNRGDVSVNGSFYFNQNKLIKDIDSTFSGLNFETNKSYNLVKKEVLTIRNQFKNQFLQLNDSISKEQFLDSVSLVFSRVLLNEIIPHWYGTPWGFNGYTNVPNQGEIACGYFVSTTLKHMGVNLNRYDLAKENPLNEAKTIAVDSLKVVQVESENIQNQFFESFLPGLYFIGLDGHVGYLYVYEEQAFFIHSNYIENRVMIEPIQNSEAFESYSYSIARITGNHSLMLSWILNKKLVVFE